MEIRFEHLTKIFKKKNREEVIAVNDFDFTLPDGKMIGLLGPSGCGKSTTLNLISGLETPSFGRVFLGETDVTKIPPEKRGIGLVFQNYALYPHLTVRNNILFPLRNLKGKAKLSKEEMNERMMKAAELVQITELLDRKPGELSGGQQQRVAIARALVKTPTVLLLDEPLSNLDARLRLQTREEIKRIQRETKITTVFVTHDQDEAMSISDIIVVMKSGVVQQMGIPQEIYDNPVNLFVAEFLGTPPVNVFDGRIENGKLFIGGNEITEINVSGKADADVTVAIRPEGFIPDENGSIVCGIKYVEILGRDISVIASHPAFKGKTFRAIVDFEKKINTSESEIRFSVRKGKTFVFSKEDETRIV